MRRSTETRVVMEARRIGMPRLPISSNKQQACVAACAAVCGVGGTCSHLVMQWTEGCLSCDCNECLYLLCLVLVNVNDTT